MKKYLAKISLFSLTAAALVAVPIASRAQDMNETNAPSAPSAPSPKKHGLPFKGKISAVDANAMSFTVGTLVINVTSKTRIVKDGKPAMFADITVGEAVTGAYKKDEAGKLNASTVRLGVKVAKAKKKATDAATTTPASPTAPDQTPPPAPAPSN